MPRHISISPHTTGSGSHDPVKQVWISTKITSHAKHQEKKNKTQLRDKANLKTRLLQYRR